MPTSQSSFQNTHCPNVGGRASGRTCEAKHTIATCYRTRSSLAFGYLDERGLALLANVGISLPGTLWLASCRLWLALSVPTLVWPTLAGPPVAGLALRLFVLAV